MSQSVRATPLPSTSRLWAMVKEGDFIDGYATPSTLTPRQAAELAFAMPPWVNALMALRNIVVKPLGLKTGAPKDQDAAIFPVHHEDAQELLLGTDDSHLNFRISILQHEGQIHMATWVHRNNWLGRLYLRVVMPFHRLISRNAMSRVARAS